MKPYTEDVIAILKDLFYEPWMEEDDWNEVMEEIEKVVSVSDMTDALTVGISNGYSIEDQKKIIKIYFKDHDV